MSQPPLNPPPQPRSPQAENRKPVLGAIVGAILGAVGSAFIVGVLIAIAYFLLVIVGRPRGPAGGQMMFGLFFYVVLPAAVLCCLSGAVGGAIGAASGRSTRGTLGLSAGLTGVVGGLIYLGLSSQLAGDLRVLVMLLGPVVLAIFGAVGGGIGVATRRSPGGGNGGGQDSRT